MKDIRRNPFRSRNGLLNIERVGISLQRRDRGGGPVADIDALGV